MPKVIYDIQGVFSSVQRPVVFDMARQIMEWTGLPIDTSIRYGGEMERVYQPGTTISGEADRNTFNTDAQWTISVSEDTQNDEVLATPVYYDDTPLIFSDTALAIYMRPTFAPVDVTLTFNAQFVDKDLARRWRDDIRTRVSANRGPRIHSVMYSYLVPKECLYILKELHRLRETVAPYGQDFDTYYNACITPKATVLTDMAGKNQEQAIRESQTEVTGWFEFETEPEKGDKAPEDSSWTINFTYKFRYNKATTCFMEYPLLVHNQMLSERFRPSAAPTNPNDTGLSYSISALRMALFRSTRLPAMMGLPGKCVPSYDEFLPEQVLPDTVRIITLLTGIDPNNLKALMNLNDLDEYLLSPEILAFLPTEAPYLADGLSSVFNVSVYHGLSLMSNNRYVVDDTLEVLLNVDASLRDVYHVRLGLAQNPRQLTRPALERLRRHYTAAKQIFWTLMPVLQYHNLPGPALPGDVMSIFDFNQCLKLIDNQYTLNKTGQVYTLDTAMSLILQGARRN